MPKDWTLRQTQEEIKKFKRRRFPHWEDQTIQIEILDLINELGNFLQDFQKVLDEKPGNATDLLKKGLGGIFYSLLSVTNKFNVSLKRCLDESLVNYFHDLPPRDTKSKIIGQKEIDEFLAAFNRLSENNKLRLESMKSDVGKGALKNLPSIILTLLTDVSTIADAYIKVTDYGRKLKNNTDAPP